MPREQYVILKGRKDGISIWLDEKADFELLMLTLRKKVADAKKFFDGANTHVAFTGRTLSEEDEKALLDIIYAETTLDVSFVEHDGFNAASAALAAAATSTNKSVPGQSSAPAPLPASASSSAPHASHTEYMTAYYRTGLRSGQVIRYNGSVVVIGDVNPGSEIIAGGNVVVLGTLKGMVHAGAAGDDRCMVSALHLAPTQLRIANIITYVPAVLTTTAVKPGGKPQRPAKKPAYAFIQDGQVYIAPLMD